jgi:hypothetical protein
VTVARITSLIAIVVGGGFALFGFLSYQRGRAEYREWVEASGQLEGTRSEFDRERRRLFRPRVRFAPQGGEERVAEVIYPTLHSRDSGEARVMYDPQDPNRMALADSVCKRRDRGCQGLFGGGLFLAVGLLGLLAGQRLGD